MIDMEAADEVLRKTEDEIETQRDPSHVKNLSKTEMLSLFETHGLAIEKCETTEIPQRLENWLALTRTPDLIREKIRQRMRADVTGNDKMAQRSGRRHKSRQRLPKVCFPCMAQ